MFTRMHVRIYSHRTTDPVRSPLHFEVDVLDKHLVLILLETLQYHQRGRSSDGRALA